MSQWLSQTRKLNNHYQSAGRGKLPGWAFGDNLLLDGVYYADGTLGLLPRYLQEPGTVDFVVGSRTYGGVTAPSGACKQSWHYTGSDNTDLYIGIYDSVEYELEYQTAALPLVLEQVQYRKGTRASNTVINLSDVDDYLAQGLIDAAAAAEWNKQTAIIPTLRRTPFFYFAKSADVALPDAVTAIIGTPAEAGTLDLSASDLIVRSQSSVPGGCFTAIAKHTPAWSMPRLPGEGPVIAYPVNLTQSTIYIYGCDFTRENSPALCTKYTGSGYFTPVCFNNGGYLATMSDGSVLTNTTPGARVAIYGNAKNAAPGTQSSVYPLTVIDYDGTHGFYMFVRQILSFREITNFKFWDV